MTAPQVRRSVALAAVVLAVAGAYVAGGGRGDHAAAAADGKTDDTVAVSGVGRVSGTPDTLLLGMSVEVRDTNVTAALDGANAALRRVRDALVGRGVARKDVQTSGLSIQPNYRYDKTGPVLIGYIVRESLSAKLRDLGKAGATISAAVAAGGNASRVEQVALDLEGDSALVTQAREKAFAAAKAKAEQYAKLSGRSLGRVVKVSETTQGPQPVPYAADMARGAAGQALSSVPIEAGSQQVSVSVDVVWSLG